MKTYNPFDKSIDDITIADLAVLRGVSEGWFIEYKRIVPNGKSISKSLSAFANSEGGWLFYGIVESEDQQRTAGEFCGIPDSEVANCEQAIRQAASAHVNPVPHFEARILRGPNADIGLLENRAIIVIRVPRGTSAPYVHCSGVIYRRIADSSEPRPETDRHILDLLWQRRKDSTKRFDKFMNKKPKRSPAEATNSIIRICFFLDPSREQQTFTKLDFPGFSRLMAGTEGKQSFDLPFDNCFATRDGFIARQARNNRADGLVLSWRYYYDCTSEIVMPLNSACVRSAVDGIRFLSGYEQAEAFLNRCRRDNMTDFHLVDLCQTYIAILAIMSRQKELLNLEGLPWSFYYKIQLTNFWRRVPFVDLKEFSEFVQRHGVPVVQDNTSYFPLGTGPDSCWKSSQLIGDDLALSDGTLMFFFICQSLGLPLSAFSPSGSDENPSLENLVRVGQRAAEATSRRNART